MKLIVGLGNPDKKYENTFHNLGFIAIDKVAEKLGVSIEKQGLKAKLALFTANGEKVILAKPQTYMNLSGESVQEILSYYKIEPKDLMVIYDDYDLKMGDLRIRKSGSAGTHNGMRNIVLNIGTTEFPRIRVGFNTGNDKIQLLDFVLSGINEENRKLLSPAIDNAVNAVIDFIAGKDFEYIMRNYNLSRK